jgi:transposase
MFTRNGKGLTAQGVKPVCPFQQVFKATWIFGAYSPFTGDHFELELPHCNSANFQMFLNEFSKQNPEEFKIIILDNGAFHKAKTLIIPHNIVLFFIPPYSPELNPSEKIWWRIKRAFTGKLHKSLDEVSVFIENEVKKLTNEIVKKTCEFEYIILAPFWTNLY